MVINILENAYTELYNYEYFSEEDLMNDILIIEKILKLLKKKKIHIDLFEEEF